MITEDYISFETAKLLKEKGFCEPCYTCYINKELSHYDYLSTNFKLIDDVISAPTLQMAMKWLRIKHNIHIRTSPYGPYSNNGKFFKYKFEIITMFYETMICVGGHKDEGYQSNEQACEAAIVYCLENLV